MKKLTILFTHYGDQWIRGSERVLLDLLEAVDPDRITPIVWTNVGLLADETERRGIATYRSDMATYFEYSSPGFDRGMFSRSVRLGVSIVREHSVDCLHANSAAPAQWLAPVAWRTRRPLLVHIHARYLRRSRVINLLHQADRLVGVTNAVLVDLRGDGVPADKLTVISNGVGGSRFAGTEAGAPDLTGLWPADAFVLVGVGSLVAHKGWDVALRALALLDGTVHLCIAGDGPERDRLVALASALGVAGRVHLLGEVDNPAALYEAGDVMLMPSRMEAFGLVAVEASLFGCAIVASRVGGVAEVIEHGATGLLVAPDEPDALAEAIGRLRRDGTLREALGVAARERAMRQFSSRAMARKFEAEYAALAGRRYGVVRRVVGLPVSYGRMMASWLVPSPRDGRLTVARG